MNEPLSPSEARKLIRAILGEGTYGFTRHAREQLLERGIDQLDCLNVLRAGWVEGYDVERGSYRYRVRSNKMTVVVAFRTDSRLTVITAWWKASGRGL